MSILPGQQSSASNTRFTKGKSAEKTKEKEAVRPHAKIPHADLDWVLEQSPTVIRLFLESWRCESFGKQWRTLKTQLQKRNLRNAMRILEKANLFKYQPEVEVINGRRVTTNWKCEYLHGYYTNYWEIPDGTDNTLEGTDNTLEGTDNTLKGIHSALEGTDNTLKGIHSALEGTDNTLEGIHSALEGTVNTLEGTDNTTQKPETRSKTEFQNSQPLPNHLLTTPQPPTKVVEKGGCIPQETPQTPLEGAGATNGGMQEEEEQEQEAPDTSTASLGDKPEVNGTPTNLGEDQFSGGDSIALQPNSDVIGVVDGDREGADEDDEVGHADIVTVICEQVGRYYYQPEERHKEVMMRLTISKLQELSQRFQTRMNQSMSLPSHAKTKLAFEFALGLAYGKPLPIPLPQS